jgi:putative nucleotidyltransferase with HDIG domain
METADRLSDRECRMLMEKVCRLPGPIVDHCRQVAVVAQTLAEKILGRGSAIDISLVRSAALVHDVARLDGNHAAVGARLLNEMGFPAMADIVAAHMAIEVTGTSPLDESQIVYLADKLVGGNTVANLRQRFAAKLEKFGHDPEAAADIDRRLQAALTIRDKVERIAGQPVDQILKTAGIAKGKPSCKRC